MACEELTYGELSERLVGNLGGRREPLSATVGLTDRCNLRCVHCFVHDPRRDRELRARELTSEQWFRIFDQLAEAGCVWMTWTGGEILLREDFADLYRYAKGKGFLVSLLTNGTLLNPDIVGLLQEWYPVVLDISLYGLTPETYEQITGSRSAFGALRRGVDWLRQAGVPFRLKTMAMTLTRRELREMYEFAVGLGIEFRHDGMLFQTYHGQDISHLRLPPAEVVALDTLHPKGRDGYHRLQEESRSRQGPHPLRDLGYRYFCGGGFRSFYVDPYGQMGLCQLTRPPVYDLASGSLAEGWRLLGELRQTKVSRDFECLHCDLVDICRRCPAFSTLEHGDPDTVIEYVCETARLRARELGFDGVL